MEGENRLEEAMTGAFERLRGIGERCETMLDTMRVYCDQARLDATNARIDRTFTVDFILAAMELADQLGAQSGTLKAKIRAMGERERLRAGLDSWFWRPEEAQGQSHENQLKKRANYLKASGYGKAEAWDLLVEFVCGWSGRELDETLLKSVIAEAFDAHGD